MFIGLSYVSVVIHFVHEIVIPMIYSQTKTIFSFSQSLDMLVNAVKSPSYDRVHINCRLVKSHSVWPKPLVDFY